MLEKTAGMGTIFNATFKPFSKRATCVARCCVRSRLRIVAARWFGGVLQVSGRLIRSCRV
jgi:hypothetical protein